MNLRSDSVHVAGWKRSASLGARAVDPANDVSVNIEWAPVPEARLGDVWRIRRQDGAVVGYGLTCPNEQCEQGAHVWSHAWDCTRQSDPTHLSCWEWSGSPETGDLTASPSLFVVKGCGWHGWLRNGEMVSV